MTERKKPGPKPKHEEPRKEYHLKFAPAIAKQIEEIAKKQGYQAYFDELVKRDLEARQGLEESR